MLCYTYLQNKEKWKTQCWWFFREYLGTASCTIKICSIFLESNLATYNKSLKTNYNL